MNMPSGVDISQYKTQAKDLLKQARAASPAALERIRAHHPELGIPFIVDRLLLSDAQLIISRENGFSSWARFKDYLLFRNAVDALDTGDLVRLTRMLDDNPSVLKYRCNCGDWYEDGYFAGAMLLHHIAGNPIRCQLPSNILEITALLLERGANPNAVCGKPPRSTTIGLVITGKQVSDAGVAVALIDLLAKFGASVEALQEPDMLTLPLWNCGLGTARALAARGAAADLRHFAGLGNSERVYELLRETPQHDLIERALIYAVVHNHLDIVEALLQAGATGDRLVAPSVGITERTALHEAANRGHREIVDLLLSRGVYTGVVEPQWGGTPAGWALHGGHDEIAELLL